MHVKNVIESTVTQRAPTSSHLVFIRELQVCETLAFFFGRPCVKGAKYYMAGLY
jgi:hypothetical protein